MSERKIETYIFFIVLAVTIYLVFLIFAPYLYTLAMAVVFAVLFDPLFKKVSSWTGRHNSLGAFITGVLVLVIVLIPLIFLGIELSQEVRNLYSAAFSQTQGEGTIYQITEVANNMMQKWNPFGMHVPVFQATDTENYILGFLSWLQGHFGDIFSGLAKFFLSMLFFLISFFYFLRDGKHIRQMFIEISPFEDSRDELILEKLRQAIISTVRGSILVAMIQGTLAGFGFFLFGIPSAALWGSVATISALVPGVGTSLVMIPGILFLFFTGHGAQALGLLIWAATFVALIDNFLGPKLVSRGMHIHPLLVMLSALGGIVFYGPTGFILGPLTLSFLIALFDIYKTIIVKDNTVTHQ